MELYNFQGQQLYLTGNERQAFAASANNTEREVRRFALFYYMA